jgi:ClpX C4-type zinc finger
MLKERLVRKPRPSAAHEICSFCGKPRSATRRIVAGPQVCICEECIVMAAEALQRR